MERSFRTKPNLQEAASLDLDSIIKDRTERAELKLRLERLEKDYERLKNTLFYIIAGLGTIVGPDLLGKILGG